MSRERTEQRLETLLAALRDPPVSLDEVAQARIQARLEAEIEHAADVAALRALEGRRRGVVRAGAGIAAVIAAAALFVVIIAPPRGKPGDSERTTAGQRARSGGAAAPVTTDGAAAGGAAAPVAAADRSAGSASASGGAAGASAAGAGSLARNPAAGDAITDAAVGREATTAGSADGADGTTTSAAAADMATTLIRVAAGESAEVTIGGALVTVYGPGWLSPKRDGAAVDAASITVNRSQGDTPWAMHYHDVKIVVTHAAFSAWRTTETRVSVMRGEIELQCPSNARTLPSGASATCGAVSKIRAASPRRAAAPEPELSSSSPRQVAAPGLEPSPPPPLEAPPPPLEAPPPSPEAGPAPVVTDRYAVAESAMRRGDLDAAGEALLAVVAADPNSLDAATALLDLARLAVRRGHTTLALDYLDRLDHHPRSAALAAATAHLRTTLTRADAVRRPPAR